MYVFIMLLCPYHKKSFEYKSNNGSLETTHYNI